MSVWLDRPQTIAVLPDALLFVTSGMNLAFGLGYNYYFVSTHFQLSWFVGVIIGVLLSAPLTQILIKRYFVLLSSLFIVTGGIVFTALPNDLVALLAARYLNGIGTGFITVPFIVHCSEISAVTKRGIWLGLEQLCTAIGIFIQVTYIAFWNGSVGISANRVHGIICIVFGVIALGLIPLVINSPIFYIRRGNDSEALNCLKRLQLPTVLSDEKKKLLEEHKNYVRANEHFGFSGSLSRGLGPLLKMIICRSVVAFTFSLPYNRQLIFGTVYGITTDNQWPSVASIAIRILGVYSACVMLDIISRKVFSLLGLLVMGGFGIGVTIIFSSASNWFEADQMSMACVLLLVFQYFAGLYAPTSTVYLGEAFPMLLKPYFIALCICAECLVHIIVICTFNMYINPVYDFNTFTYVYLFACFLLFIFTIPETKLTTLNEAQERLRKWNNLRSW